MDKKIILSTDRLYMTEFGAHDAPHLYDLNSDPNVIRYTGDPPFKDIKEAQDFIDHYDHYIRYGMGRWAVRLISSKTFIGWCGLKTHENGDTDLGFRFMRAFWGRGYATEAARGALRYGFDEVALERIIARVMPQNAGSIRVIEKLEMNFIGNIVCDEHPAKLYELKKNQSL